jgi:ribonuclease HII
MPYYTKPSPTFDFERQLWRQGLTKVVGIDEVGRGALAGPVVIAAVCFDPNHQPITGVRDSKLLSAKQRLSVVEQLKKQALFWQVGQAEASEIDAQGIVPATMLAIARATTQLPSFDQILMDGKPFIAQHIPKIKNWPTQPFTYIVKGDQLSYSIAAASIIAKVCRDELMQKLATTHADYGWEQNVGYGTKLHRDAIQQYGISSYHRLTFCINSVSNTVNTLP